MNDQHPAVAMLEEMRRAGAIDGWKHFKHGFDDAFRLHLGEYGVDVSFGLLETEFWVASSARFQLQQAAFILDLAVRICADQPAELCALTPRKVPELIDMPLPKGYRWPVTTIMGECKRNPVPSLHIGMLSLYSAAWEVYRRTGSWRRTKRALVALNIALAFDQRLPDDALYAVRCVSADRVLQRIRGRCRIRRTHKVGFAADDTCSGRSGGHGPWCLTLPRDGRDGFCPTHMWGPR